MSQHPNALITARLAEIDREIAALNAEADELRVARKVNERLFGVYGPKIVGATQPARNTPSKTIGERVEDAIREFGPMTSNEIWERLKAETPHTTFPTISGTLQRCQRQGRIAYDADAKAWRVIEKASDHSEASQEVGDVAELEDRSSPEKALVAQAPDSYREHAGSSPAVSSPVAQRLLSSASPLSVKPHPQLPFKR